MREAALAEARAQMKAGYYDKAAELLNMVLGAWPGDAVALDLQRQVQQLRGDKGPIVVPDFPIDTNFAVRLPRHTVSASADYFLGQGTVTLPLGFSLAKSLASAGANVTPKVTTADRKSDYFGAAVSYAYKEGWFLDLGFVQGSSSGNAPVSLGNNEGSKNLDSKFTIDDQYYQAYVRYAFPRFIGSRFSAYLRAGVSFVDAELTDTTQLPEGAYKQKDKTQDLLGNLGAGVGYSWLLGSGEIQRWRVGVQLEVEAFYGIRKQESLETLKAAGSAFNFETATIDNTLYGGIGRGTLRAEYDMSRKGQRTVFKAFLEGGMQAKYTFVNYPDQGEFQAETFPELLWGPYVKLGLRYSF